MSDPSETIVAGSSEMDAGTAPPLGRGHVTRHPSPKEYIRIALILAFITGLEVAIYYMDLSHAILIPALFFFSLVKFVLVVMWFMHLRFDSRTYSRFFVMGVAGAVTLFLIVLMTFRVFQG
jgi:cytochrome c oxidase subunit IV